MLRASSVPLYRYLLRGKIDRQLVAYMAIRARHFDACARKYAGRHQDAVVVNLGCGFDTRFHRIDDGRLRLFDLGRAEVIRQKRQLLEEETLQFGDTELGVSGVVDRVLHPRNELVISQLLEEGKIENTA